MSRRAVVVGGGMVGAACVDVLARQNWQITVVEVGGVGGGATAAGMGHLVVMDDSPAQLAMTSLSLTLWDALAPKLPAAADYRRCGTLWIASDADELHGAQPKQRQYRSAGREATLLGAGELARYEPNLRPGLAGALRVPDDAVVYAPVVARFLIERAGAVVRRDEVMALDGRAVRLRGGDRLPADLIVIAAGTAATRLLPDLPLRARKGHLVITERTDLAVQHQLVELGYLKSAHSSDGDSVAFNVQPRPTGQLLIGSSRQFGPMDKDIDWPLLHRMLSRAAEFLPGLVSQRALRIWTGLRSATPDHLPVVGPHPEHPEVFLAVGHEGLGITTALATAEVLGAFLSGGRSPFPDVQLGLERFGAAVHHA